MWLHIFKYTQFGSSTISIALLVRNNSTACFIHKIVVQMNDCLQKKMPFDPVMLNALHKNIVS